MSQTRMITALTYMSTREILAKPQPLH